MIAATPLEMKMEVFELLTHTHDEWAVRLIYSKVQEALDEIDERDDWWDELSEAQQVRLEQSIEDSYDPKNLMTHETVMKKYEKWLKK